MKKLYLLILVIKLTCIHLQAQSFIPNDYVSYYFNPQNLGFSTPQTAELAKYTQSSVNYYNGLLDFELPILSYKDASFDIPITIKYISDGFKPGRRPSFIGNNWALNVGGVITRNVIGSPDDVRGYKEENYTGKYLLDGLLVAIRDGKYKYYSKEVLYNTNVDKTSAGNPYIENDLEFDYAPDIFNFSFGGYKGYFFIGNDGQIKSSLGEGFKIDISNMSIQNYSTTNAPANSTIKITTPGGYIYEFGGNTSYLEYNIPNNPNGIKKSPVQIISWYLKSICNVINSRTANFTYSTHEQKNVYKLFLSNTYESWMSYPPGTPIRYAKGTLKDCITIEDRIQTPIIRDIEIDDVHISFDVKVFPTSFYDGGHDLLYLNKITKSCGNVQKSVSFNYQQSGKYFFLKRMNLNSQAVNPDIYSFDYNLDTNLPDSKTISVDHWGFWNGGYATSEDVESYLNNIENRKAVNTGVYNTAMLTKITFPTKGKTIITYEPNYYNYWSTRNENDRIDWETNYSSNPIPCGGVRIKTIVDYEPLSKKEIIRTYNYITTNGRGSGIVGILPQYKLPEEYINPPWGVSRESSISSNTIGRLHNISEHHIGYSDVVELYNDNSYNHYHFSSMLDIPDDETVNSVINSFSQYRSFNRAQILLKFGLYNSNDMSGYRGKLLSKITYSNKQEMLLMQLYTYNTNEWLKNYEVSILSSTMGYAANRIYYTPCRVVKELQTDINGVEIHKMYSYNAKNLVSEKCIVQSNADTLRLSYTYPFENSMAISGTNYLSNLIRLNKIDIPILTIKSIQRKNMNYTQILSAVKYNFGNFNNQFLRSTLSEWSINNPANTACSIENGNFTVKEQYLKYDNYSNITYLIDKNRDKFVYIWSHKGKYPIAEIKGVTYADVENQLTRTFIDNLSLSSPTNIDMQKINELRIKLPNAHVTTYTYHPLVGILTSTDPAGLTMTYEYDISGRLVRTKDTAGKVIEEYEYNYSK